MSVSMRSKNVSWHLKRILVYVIMAFKSFLFPIRSTLVSYF